MKPLYILLGLAATAISMPALADLLTFDDLSCNGPCSVAIDQSYGDVPGGLDVQYDRNVNDAVPNEALRFWDTQFGDLANVAYGGVDASTGTAEIFLQPSSGMQVTLLGFDLGAWPTTDRTSAYAILSGSGQVLALSSGSFIVSGAGRSSFAFNLTSADGLRIRWGPDAYNVGIDNIQFAVRPVPEPGSWAVLVAGCFLLGLVTRSRLQVRVSRACWSGLGAPVTPGSPVRVAIGQQR